MALTQTQSGSGGGTVAVSSLPPLPAGSNAIGTVVLGAGAAAVGTVGVTSLPALPTGANVIGGVTQSGTWTVQPGNTANTTAWKVDGSAVTQPVSGTVTANAGSGTFPMQATAGSPGSVELSDGSAFYVGAKTGQLPTALVGSRLDVNVGKIPGTVSSVNSSTATLTGNSVFTGTGEDVSQYAAVTVFVATDQISAVNGLSLQWSSDNSNWDLKQTCSVTSFDVTGGTAPGVVITTPTLAQFFRLVYTNGAVGQTAFRLQSLYHSVAPPPFAVSGTNQGVRPIGASPMLWDSTNDIYGPMRSFGTQPDNAGGSTAGVTGLVALNASSNPDRLRTAPGATGTTGTGLLGAGPCLWDLVGTANFVKQAGDGSGRAMVVGAAAAGAVVAGNPVLMGMSDGTNAQNLRCALPNNNGLPNTGVAAVALYLGQGSGTYVPMNAASAADGDNSSGAASLPVAMFASNGAGSSNNFDRWRNTNNVIVQASTSTAAGTVNTDITTYNGRSFIAHANVTAYGAAGTFLMKLQWKDANGLFMDIPGATTGTLTTGADIILAVGPNPWPPNTATAFYSNFPLPRTIRLVTTVGVNNVTFAQSYDIPV